MEGSRRYFGFCPRCSATNSLLMNGDRLFCQACETEVSATEVLPSHQRLPSRQVPGANHLPERKRDIRGIGTPPGYHPE
jgi:ribosomal protein S27AE